MRKLLASTAVLCTFSTVRPGIRTIRRRELKRAMMFLFLLGWLGLAMRRVSFSVESRRQSGLLTIVHAVVQSCTSPKSFQRCIVSRENRQSCAFLVYVTRFSCTSYYTKRARTLQTNHMKPVRTVQTDERHLGPSSSLNQSVERQKIWQFRLVSLITWPVVI